MAFLLQSVDMVNYTDCFVNAKPTLHSWNLPQLIMRTLIHFIVF